MLSKHHHMIIKVKQNKPEMKLKYAYKAIISQFLQL